MGIAEDWSQSWLNPGSTFRGAPFWAWNSKLDSNRLCDEIGQMQQAGLGGFFMHSRYGLKTPYLSDEWFRCVSACVEKARQLGMKAYLYDEDRWPSGAAGGLVTRPNPTYGARALAMSQSQPASEGAKRIAAFEVELDAKGLLVSYKAGGGAVAFDIVPSVPSGWYNDGAHLDSLNAQAVAEFIRVTHQAYADRYGKDFGGLIPAIFTDEPNYASDSEIPQRGMIPWTAKLPERFKARRGYDIRAHLPELFFNPAGGEFSKVRHDYFRTLTELFVENYSRQIGRWCGRNNIALTGHMLHEESLDSQIRHIGAAMPHYEHMQWPGIDILCDQDKELATAKQTSSVADQLGKERVLSELYGCTGWDFSLEGHKFVGDWQLATGVNLRCQHLIHYSLAGGAKRDYPASIYSHSPWWPFYPVVEDYFGRLCFMLTRGKPVRDVLVIHPIESAWGLYDPQAKLNQRGTPVDKLNASFQRVIRHLTGQHYDWDFADESLLAKYGKVSAKGIDVGRMTYQVVVVPPAITLRATTLAILKDFIAAGGKVIFVGQGPGLIDAMPNSQACELIAAGTSCDDTDQALLAAMENSLPRRVSIVEDGRQQDCIWYMFRKVPRGHVLFAQSHDRQNGHRLQFSVQACGPVVVWDAMTGKQRRIKSVVADGRVKFEIDMPPTGSVLVSIGLNVASAAEPAETPKVVDCRQLAGPYEIELTEPNTMPLDYCTFSIGDEPFSGPMHSLKADEMIRARYGLGERFGRAHQPWYLYATGVVDVAPRGRVRIGRTFHVSQVPARCMLAMEQPGNFQVTVNGKPIPAPTGFWVDIDIKTIDIANLIQPGENEVMLDMDYRPDMELEDLYLVGDFGVARRDDQPRSPDNMTIVAPPARLSNGSWVGQGLDFYSGAVRYKLNVNRPAVGRVVVKLPGITCTAAAIRAGDKLFPLPWAPFEADITDALKVGDNTIAIEVVGGRKNILGPLHVPWEAWTGPMQFRPNHPGWQKDYLLFDHGISSPVVVEILE
jgi:hypothetical protein